MLRTRFRGGIVAEFLPPVRPRGRRKVVILCDGMPGIPRKQPLAEFLSARGYWVIYPRYRGSWESDGVFLERSPHEDILEVIGQLPKGLKECAFGETFRPLPEEIFVIGGSFGGAAAILVSLDSRVKKVIANCPVVDWSILPRAEKAETANASYAAYIRSAFGRAYRLTDRNWRKLYTGRFYSPIHHAARIVPSKVMMFHAKDDPHVPWQSVDRFARRTGIALKLLERGGHLKTEYVVQKYWPQIRKFLDAAA